jgi:hypothetical protein
MSAIPIWRTGLLAWCLVTEPTKPKTRPKPKPKSHSAGQQESKQVVYGVHAVKTREVCETRFLTTHLTVAERYAKTLSEYPGVLAAAVTRYVLEAEGQHRAEALYVQGVRQQVPYVSDNRLITTSGPAWLRAV